MTARSSFSSDTVWFSMKVEDANLERDSFPLVSVIMPVRNEANYIAGTLRSVFAQDYPYDRMEVIVADGISSDGTRDIVRSFQTRHQNIALIDNPGRIAPTGLNAALRAARGTIVIRIDGHCEPASDYLSLCVRHLQDSGVDGVGGPLHTIGESFVAGAIAAAMSSPFGVGGSAFRTVKDRAMRGTRSAIVCRRQHPPGRQGCRDCETHTQAEVARDSVEQVVTNGSIGMSSVCRLRKTT